MAFPCVLYNTLTTAWNAHCARAAIKLLGAETPEFIPPQLWPPNSPDLHPVDYGMWEILQEKVYKAHITDLDKLKERLRMEWAKLDHVVVAAAIR